MLSIVVPIYNEEETLVELHRRVTAAIPPGEEHELVLVDDGSRDGSWAIVSHLAALDPRIRGVRLSRNFGHQAAISAGLGAARGDAVVVLDGDLQDPPELIGELVARWRDGFDVVYAIRAERTGEKRARLLAIRVFYKLLRRIAGSEIPENVGDFRLMSRRVVDAIDAMPERARFLRGMTSWVGFEQTGVPYTRDPRYAGSSKYPPRKLLQLALDGITSFSTVPIRLVAWLGFVLVVFCFGVLAWVLYTYFFTDRAPQGWTSLLAVVLLLGGVQLLSLGIIGQYVARIFEESKQRPLYLVSETLAAGSAEAPPLPAAADHPGAPPAEPIG
ncbi:MAG TPA: glycosyltransferase family 2 protein [Gaiellaceae bacterium]|nr:glycosyltransferase family 2 protein [Gaiellaceae bacterium]